MPLRPLISSSKIFSKLKLNQPTKYFGRELHGILIPQKGYVGKRPKVSPSPIKTNKFSFFPPFLKSTPLFLTNGNKSET